MTVEALLDTGSEISFLDETTARAAEKLGYRVNPEEGKVQLADGQIIPLPGSIDLPVEIADHTVRHAFRIMPTLTNSALIGIDLNHASQITMTEDLNSLKKRRGSVKSSLTRFKNFLDNYNANTDVKVLKVRLERAKTLLTDFEKIHLEIEIGEDTDDQASKQVFEEHYFEYVARAQSLLEHHLRNSIPNNVNDSIAHSTSDITMNSARVESSIKLPSITLPKFDGKYEDWLSFEDNFRALVHNNLKIQPNHVRALFELSAVTKKAMSNLNSLIDTPQKHIQSLRALGQPTYQWNGLLLHLITSKLDKITHREWENFLDGTELPNIDDLWKFLHNKCHVLQAVAGETSNSSKATNKAHQVLLEAQSKSKCHVCSKNHSIIFCDSFKQLDHSKKLEAVKKAGLCFNCLRSNHQVSSCNAGNCKKCEKRHNTLLHPSRTQTTDMNTKDNVNHNSSEQVMQRSHATTSQVLSSRFKSSSQVILSTAMIDIEDAEGYFHTCRAVLDTGSQSNFISSQLCDRLNLPKRSISLPIQGIGNSLSHIKHSTNTIIRSRSNAFFLDLQLLVISNITAWLPSQPIDHSKLGIPDNVQLANPEFYKPASVDILIGAEYFYHLLCVSQVKLKSQAMIIQNTQLGNFEDNLVQRFWETEELPAKRLLSPEEEQCEAQFMSTFKRDENDRNSVGLPFNSKKNALGDPFNNAKRRFHTLERKLVADHDLYEAYHEFLQDYESLNHMSEVSQADNDGYNYIPHHAVLKESSLTTKLRVIFDALAKTTTGLSLNDALLTDVYQARIPTWA
ncbi:PREDICTED: uncharacterized protein LOC108768655 [Trachymyrmex cornetzi]|uniref:uncharacterized protein LOC108768655 n=1 Tax=Trachymyrmex cornetzi TaxID=471704 RepID=UPI00084EFB4D|nr:PREDICTED: uncharacterized protein LOC108768655 [Trachymyrmex cornetzi]